MRSLDPPLTGKDAWRDVEPRIASLQCTKDLEVVDKRDVFARVTRELRVKEAEQEREERKRLLDEERSKRGALRGVVSAKMQAGELDEGAGCVHSYTQAHTQQLCSGDKARARWVVRSIM